MIGDVVAMQAVGTRLEIRRGIGIAHAEVMQIRYEVARRAEGKMPVELQPVSGRWDAWMWCGHGQLIILTAANNLAVQSIERCFASLNLTRFAMAATPTFFRERQFRAISIHAAERVR